MPNWKKVVVSGSRANLSHITSSGNLSASGDLIIKDITASGNIRGTGKVRGEVILTKPSGSINHSIHIDGGKIKFFDSSQDDFEHADYRGDKEKARLRAVPGSFNIALEISGSRGYTSSVYISQSGKIGFNTDDPQSQFDAVVAGAQFQKPGERKGLRINDEGNIESFNRDANTATTGSEFVLRYSRGTTVNEAMLEAVTGQNFANDSAAVDFFNTLKPEEQNSILEKAEALGFNALPSVGDVIGSIRFIAESGSTGAGSGFDDRETGEAASITSVVHSVDDTGVRGDLVFKVADQTGAAVQRMVLDSGDVHQLTGSFVIGGPNQGSGAVFLHGTSGNTLGFIGRYGASTADKKIGRTVLYDDGTPKVQISAKGKSYITAANDGTHTTGARLGIETTDPKVELEVVGEISASSNIYGKNIVSTTHITASGNISASGDTHIFGGQVGIDTAPAAGVELHVNGEVRVDSTDGVATRKIRSSYFSSASDIRVEAGSAGDVILGDNAAARLTLGADDSALFTGNITASGDISASGDVEALTFTSPTLDVTAGSAQMTANIPLTFGTLVSGNTGRLNIKHDDSDGSITNNTGVLTIGNSGAGGIKLGQTATQHVTASGNISASGTIAAIQFIGDGSQLSGISAAGNFVESEGTASLTNITASGNISASGDTHIFGGQVGIGTTSPSEKLHVYGNSNADVKLKIENDFSGKNAQLILDSGASGDDYILFNEAGTTRGLIVYDGGTDVLKIINDGSAGTEHFAMDTSGNIGIGTTAPPEKLTVVGDISASVDIHAQQNIIMGLKTDDPKLSIYNNVNVNNLYTHNSQSVNNATFVIQGGNWTHALKLKDSYNPGSVATEDIADYAKINGGYTHESRLTLFTSTSYGGLDAGATTTIGTATSSLPGILNIGDSINFNTTTGNTINSVVNLILNADSDANSSDAYRNTIFQNRGTEVARIDVAGNITASGDISSSGTTTTQLLELPSGAAGSKGINLGTHTHIYESGGLNFDGGTSTRPIYFRINGTKKLELDTAGNITASGDIVLQGTAPSIRIQDTRQLNNPDWDSVSLGNIEFYSSDTTSPGARVLSEIEAFSNNAAASGPNSDLIFKTSANTDSSPQTRLTIGYEGTSTFAGNVTAGSNSLTAGSLDINGNADISGDLDLGGDLKLDLGDNIRFGGQLALMKESNGELKLYGGTNSTDGGFELFTWNGSSYVSAFTLKNNQTAAFVGDVTVAGTLTAQEFHTEFVSASIVYESGSTKFGDTSDDIHSFTGSIFVSSSGTI